MARMRLSGVAVTLVLYVVLFHVAVFVVEAFLWMRPGVHERALETLNPTVTLELHAQASTLRALFVNQGFYNLFLAVGGIAGLVLAWRGNPTAGHTLIRYACGCAIGAGLVLAATTLAYAGAFLQAAPAAAALVAMRRGRCARRPRLSPGGT